MLREVRGWRRDGEVWFASLLQSGRASGADGAAGRAPARHCECIHAHTLARRVERLQFGQALANIYASLQACSALRREHCAIAFVIALLDSAASRWSTHPSPGWADVRTLRQLPHAWPRQLHRQGASGNVATEDVVYMLHGVSASGLVWGEACRHGYRHRRQHGETAADKAIQRSILLCAALHFASQRLHFQRAGPLHRQQDGQVATLCSQPAYLCRALFAKYNDQLQALQPDEPLYHH
jgi:hypothetical protein